MTGQRVTYWQLDDATGEETPIQCEVLKEWYEDGDPQPGYTLKVLATGETLGSICSSWCSPAR